MSRRECAAASASLRWRNYEFDFPGYMEAVEQQQQFLLAATEASKRLDVANEIVKEYEDKLRLAMENAMGECRVYAKERAGVQ